MEGGDRSEHGGSLAGGKEGAGAQDGARGLRPAGKIISTQYELPTLENVSKWSTSRWFGRRQPLLISMLPRLRQSANCAAAFVQPCGNTFDFCRGTLCSGDPKL